jgi:hypothetical protein
MIRYQVSIVEVRTNEDTGESHHLEMDLITMERSGDAMARLSQISRIARGDLTVDETPEPEVQS